MSLFESSKHTFPAPGEPAPERCIFWTFLKTPEVQMKKVVKYCVYQDILLMGSINVTKYVYHMPWVEWSPWQSCRPCCTRTLFQASGTCSARAAHLGQNERFGFLGCVLLVLILIQQNGCFKQCLNACFDVRIFFCTRAPFCFMFCFEIPCVAYWCVSALVV